MRLLIWMALWFPSRGQTYFILLPRLGATFLLILLFGLVDFLGVLFFISTRPSGLACSLARRSASLVTPGTILMASDSRPLCSDISLAWPSARSTWSLASGRVLALRASCRCVIAWGISRPPLLSIVCAIRCFCLAGFIWGFI